MLIGWFYFNTENRNVITMFSKYVRRMHRKFSIPDTIPTLIVQKKNTEYIALVGLRTPFRKASSVTFVSAEKYSCSELLSTYSKFQLEFNIHKLLLVHLVVLI